MLQKIHLKTICLQKITIVHKYVSLQLIFRQGFKGIHIFLLSWFGPIIMANYNYKAS